MSALPQLEMFPVVSGAYRAVDTRDLEEPHLEAASDALSLALLSLAGTDDEDEHYEKRLRAQQARAFLAEAAQALARARVFHPGVRTLSVPAIMATQRNIEAELARLHQLATRLTWQNHHVLPARRQGRPLLPEDEAQLARVFQGLARTRGVLSALRYRKLGLPFAVTVAAFVLGGAPWALAAFAASLGCGLWTQLRGVLRR